MTSTNNIKTDEIKRCLHNVERKHFEIRKELSEHTAVLQNKSNALLLIKTMMNDLKVLSKSFVEFTNFESDLFARRRKRLRYLVKLLKPS